jgi:hypothetical protein
LASDLQGCTIRLWLPEKESEDHFYLNDGAHGETLTDLPLQEDGSVLLQTIGEACDANEGFPALSANLSGYWPVMSALDRIADSRQTSRHVRKVRQEQKSNVLTNLDMAATDGDLMPVRAA